MDFTVVVPSMAVESRHGEFESTLKKADLVPVPPSEPRVLTPPGKMAMVEMVPLNSFAVSVQWHLGPASSLCTRTMSEFVTTTPFGLGVPGKGAEEEQVKPLMRCSEDQECEPSLQLWADTDWPTLLPRNRSSRELVRTPTPHHGTPKFRQTQVDEEADKAGSEYKASDKDAKSAPMKVGATEAEEAQVLVGTVTVTDVYDFYDPSTSEYAVLPMSPDVLHSRMPLERYALKSQPGDCSNGSSDCSSHSEGFSCRSGSGRTEHRERRSMRQSLARSQVEVLTRWGILAGKLIFHRVLTLTTMSSIFVGKVQIARGLQVASVWKRVQNRAKRVVEKAKRLTQVICEIPPDILDSECQSPFGFLKELFTSEYPDTLMIITKAAQRLFAAQPVLAEVGVPCRVFGDIHGQFRDLLMLFHAFGFPGQKNAEGVNFVFNGDFVDRGAHQLEVIGLLLALKVAMPNQVWLVRGNHEDRCMNAKYGFLDECIERLGENMGQKTHDLIQDVFDQLPLACRVGGSVLCVHGGIGDGKWDLNDLRALRRPISDQDLHQANMRWALDILWSDPIEDDRDDDGDSEGQDASPVFGVHESPRIGAAHLFGWDVTKTFCARNGLGMIVRSHQSKKDGMGFDIMHDSMLARVFSARDYEHHGNDGAVLLISEVDAPGNGLKSLQVRPQVLRSVMKTRLENSLKRPQVLDRISGQSRRPEERNWGGA
ncbi:unnamed protein product [Polarella glacialis]|uniref:Serine/threonine-protein phosphatase n=1 Tax=Polarella glacialis TaxID=89957 RepID=A0A813ESD2_POLGL|nr:unnamed protein product [Polarella glacialis]